MERLQRKLEELFGIDLRALGIFRICLALVILIDLMMRATDLEAFYSDLGVLPRTLLLQESSAWRLSIYLIHGMPGVIGMLFFLHGLAALGLLIGWHTRLATLITWLFTVSLHLRNPAILNGGDFCFRLFLFWSLFLPLGRRYSFDNFLSPSPGKDRDRALSMGTAGFLIQVVFIYSWSLYMKAKYPDWWNGTAIYDILKETYYTKSAGIFLLNFPGFVKILTHSVFLFEAALPLLLFSPFFTTFIRMATILGTLLLQLGFGLCMSLGLFPLSMTIAMIPFIPSPIWDNLLRVREGEAKEGRFLKSSMGTNILAAFFLIYITFWNLGSSNYPRYQIPLRFAWLGWLLYIDQYWGMYPSPCPYAYRFSMPAKLTDGTKIDVLNQVVSKNYRWRRYVGNLLVPSLPSDESYLAWYQCQRWNSAHESSKQMEGLAINLTWRYFSSSKPESQKKTLLKYTC